MGSAKSHTNTRRRVPGARVLGLRRILFQADNDELIALRDRYAALSGAAAPKLIEHLAEQEEGAADRFADYDDGR